jgi:pimeloyl-ACP methyl ester carboxylesterase
MVLGDIGSVVSAEGLKRILSYVGATPVFASKDEAMSNLKSILATWGVVAEAHWQQLFEASFTPLADGRYAFAYDPDISIAFREAASKAGAVADIDLTIMWNMIACPVLILRGAKSDILTRATAEAMLNRSAPTKLVEFENVGHAPSLLDESQIRVIAEWLDIKQ